MADDRHVRATLTITNFQTWSFLGLYKMRQSNPCCGADDHHPRVSYGIGG